MQARGQTQTVTLPITAPKPGQEPGHRVTLQPGRVGRGGVEEWVCGWLELSGLLSLPA